MQTAQEVIEQDIREPTDNYFDKNPFYQNLPPRLAQRLALCCLQRKLYKFQYFFKPVGRLLGNRMQTQLKVAVVTQLRSVLYA